MLIRSLFFRLLAAAPPDPQTVILPLMGQSNMLAWSGDDGGRDFPTGVMEYNQAGNVVQAFHRLVHRNNQGSQASIDPAIEFAHAYMAARPQDTLIFVPCAQGGTGFGQGEWNPGDVLYEYAVARVNAALALDPAHVLACTLWVQGESDTFVAAHVANYAGAFDAMFAAYKVDVPAAANSPFLVAGMVQEWVDLDADRQAVQADIVAAPGRNAGLYYVDCSDLAGANGDIIHYAPASYRTMGERFFQIYNTIVPAPPVVEDATWVVEGSIISQYPGGITQPLVNGDIIS